MATSSSALSTRLKYLNESAHALALLAPVTSSSLGAEMNRLTREHRLEVLLDARRDELCAACGTVFVTGKSCTVSVEKKPRRVAVVNAKNAHEIAKLESRSVKRRSDDAALTARSVMLRKCGRCGRETRSAPMPPPKPATRVKKFSAITPKISTSISVSRVTGALHQSASFTEQVNDSMSKTPSGNAGSKQRAKARKQGGLSAMLAKNKAEGSLAGGSALNLMDFMKIG